MHIWYIYRSRSQRNDSHSWHKSKSWHHLFTHFWNFAFRNVLLISASENLNVYNWQKITFRTKVEDFQNDYINQRFWKPTKSSQGLIRRHQTEVEGTGWRRLKAYRRARCNRLGNLWTSAEVPTPWGPALPPPTDDWASHWRLFPNIHRIHHKFWKKTLNETDFG